MKLACQEGMTPGKGLKEKLALLEEYGYEGIEFGGRALLDKAKVDEVIRLTQDSSVKPSTLCAGYGGCLLSPDPQQRQLAIDDIKTLLEVTARIGAIGLITVPIFGPPQLPDLSPYKNKIELENDLLTELLYDIAKHAEQVGSILLLEPLNRYETHFVRTLAQAVEFAQKINNPSVKIMADFFHMSIEEQDIAQSIRQAGEYIYHIHLADSTRLLPGYGHTDFASGFAALKEIGFDKYMAMECGIPGKPEEELPKSAQYLKQFI